MKKIKLTKGKYALVDDVDFDYLSQWRWKYHKDGYAVRGITGGANLYMHRVVNKTPAHKLTDHINRDGLDNRRSNLRVVNHQQNALNSKEASNNTSGIKGVVWHKGKSLWQAQININKKCIYLGSYSSKSEARVARLEAEKLYAV